MKLADEGGIKAVSMRKIAQELGVEAMSLYNHVASKAEIVDGIVDLVATEIDLAPDEADWKAAMRRRVISAHEVLLQHPVGGEPLDVGPDARRRRACATRTRCSAAFAKAASRRS